MFTKVTHLNIRTFKIMSFGLWCVISAPNFHRNIYISHALKIKNV